MNGGVQNIEKKQEAPNRKNWILEQEFHRESPGRNGLVCLTCMKSDCPERFLLR